MNTLVVIAALIAGALAAPHSAEIVNVEQDSLGNYKYSISGPHGLSRVERREVVPTTVAAYSYIEPQPILRKVPYTVEERIPVSVEVAPKYVAKTEALPILRNVELAHTPLVREIEIPQASLVKSAYTPLVRELEIPQASLVKTAYTPVVRELEIPQASLVKTAYTPLVSELEIPQASLVKSAYTPLVRELEIPQASLVKSAYTPLVRELEIPQASLVKTAYVEQLPVASTSFLRVAAVPESPEILDFESRQFAAHVAHKNLLHI